MTEELFSRVAVKRTIGGRSLAASLSIHFTIVALMAAWRIIGPTQHLRFRIENYELQVIRYNLPEPLLFAAAGRQGGGGGSQGGSPGGEAGKSGRPGSQRPGRLTVPLPAEVPAAVAASAPRPAAAPVAVSAVVLPPAPAPPKPTFQVQSKPVSRPRDVIIQPEFSPQVRITGKVEMPNLFLWMQREMQPPARQLKTFVPGERRRVPRSPMALPDAAPKIEVPNREVQVSDLKIGFQPELPKRPELPVFQANTTPVRIPRTTLDAPAELPNPALPLGEPVNLLALMERPAPPAASYSVEGGNRIPAGETSGGSEPDGKGGGTVGGREGGDGARGESAGTGAQAGASNGGAGTGRGAAAGRGAGPAGSGTGAAGAGGTGRAGTGSGGGPAGSGRGTGGSGVGAGTGAGTGTGSGGKGVGSGPGAGSGTGAGSGSGAGAGAGPGTGGSGRGSGSGTGGSGAGGGSRPGGMGSSVDAAGLRLGANSVPIRTESPNTSSFDVVVVHQSPREVMPDSPGLLSGQPIYTVYMAVPGSRREWILQYAIPRSRDPVQRQTSNSVRLGAVTPLRAPYPLRKAMLQLDGMGTVEGRVVVYGAISEKGSVENLRVVRGVRFEVDTAAMACLRQFQFRPAVRDGVPVLVEALFGIPLN